MIEYRENRETGKMELHFSKSEYAALPETSKQSIKSAFLWSSRSGCWVSREKFPNFYTCNRTAEKIGAVKAEAIGERLSFSEQMEQKAARAEERAERYDRRAERAAERGNEMQKPINEMHGDIAFFTQPNINSSAGRAFTRRREKMFAAFDRGFEEFKKSAYYSEKAETARETARTAAAPSVDFCERRIREAEKAVKAQEKNAAHYMELLGRLEKGETIKRINGENLTAETVIEWIEKADDIAEASISKIVYYKEQIEKAGGIRFSSENVKPGYIVRLLNRYTVEVLSTGPKNIKYKTDCGFSLCASYAEIAEIIKAEEKEPAAHPFRVGERFTIKEYRNGDYSKRVETVYTITKATEKTVVLTDGEKVLKRQPKIRQTCNGDMWALFITDYDGFYRPVTA